MTPLGIGIGWAATSADPQHSTLASAIVVSMSAGSFLFISVLELLPAALHDGRFVAGKLAAFLAGFVAMAALAAYV
jgi:zinc transporter ZupT